ncbi:hypothetical protein KW786_02660 [Candidatus Parcubacteria bacterium]|nr:hypothetical protein [Candidatus Parcubacteria bacterium]
MDQKRIIKSAGLLNELLLSHELMHELTAIKWSLSMILKGKFGSVNEEQKDIVSKLIVKNETLISLVDALLGGHHGEPGSGADVQACVQDMMSVLAEAAQRKHIEVALVKPNAPRWPSRIFLITR